MFKNQGYLGHLDDIDILWKSEKHILRGKEREGEKEELEKERGRELETDRERQRERETEREWSLFFSNI